MKKTHDHPKNLPPLLLQHPQNKNNEAHYYYQDSIQVPKGTNHISSQFSRIPQSRLNSVPKNFPNTSPTQDPSRCTRSSKYDTNPKGAQHMGEQNSQFPKRRDRGRNYRITDPRVASGGDCESSKRRFHNERRGEERSWRWSSEKEEVCGECCTAEWPG